MATATAEAIVRTGPRFRVGRKKVYLPGHVLAYLAPQKNQPPNHATFLVPLKFNKLDMRDYLYHVYGVEVTAVRSSISQPAPKQKNEDVTGAGKWYRPQAQKIMTVELAKPFLYPEMPKDLSPWDQAMYDRFKLIREEQSREQADRLKGKIPMRDEVPAPEWRIEMAKHAQALLQGKVKWSNRVQLDPKWTEDTTQARGQGS